MGQRYIRALNASSVLATAKHFPGHGDTDQDSHRTLPSLAHSRERLESVELIPFRAAVAAGIGSIMTAHVAIPSVDPSRLPATLSSHVLTGLMREDLHFSGLVVTDSMEMKAIARDFGTVAGVQMAIAAGADQVLVSHQPEQQSEAYLALIQAFQRGKISSPRVREALNRIRQTKAGLSKSFYSLAEADRIEANRLAQKIWLSAVAGIGATEKLPVLDSVVLVTFGANRRSEPEPHPLAAAFGEQLHAHLRLDRNPSSNEVAEVHRASKGYPLVVALDRALADPAQLTVLYRPWTDGPTVALALASPYDLRRLPVDAIGLTAFDPSPEAMAPLVAVLRGDAPLRGRWPVSLDVERH
jgi:beta-N-acetylhexosaminidase